MNIIQWISENDNIIQVIFSLCMLLVTIFYVVFTWIQSKYTKQAFLEALKCGGDTNSDTYNELSLCYVQERDFNEAKKCLMKAFEMEPESTKIISNLGYLSLKEGNTAEAQKYFSTVLEIDPNDKIAQIELSKLEV